ncbi:hypothetical protein V502_04640 [Pseudogymnoascus sp. VKM F-4520 (FW-2644)]|nr:hypothetical protein V502_04640 [Pseudogymnoascus sp. VKM F-4520 (FW-2644)]
MDKLDQAVQQARQHPNKDASSPAATLPPQTLQGRNPQTLPGRNPRRHPPTPSPPAITPDLPPRRMLGNRRGEKGSRPAQPRPCDRVVRGVAWSGAGGSALGKSKSKGSVQQLGGLSTDGCGPVVWG